MIRTTIEMATYCWILFGVIVYLAVHAVTMLT